MDTRQLLNNIGARIVELTQDKLRKQGLSESSIITNISYDVEEINEEYELVIRTPEYAINIDKGRRKGAKMPPKKPIEDWMKAKGIPMRASFPIRRAISIRGIKPRPFLDTIVNNIANIEDILFDFEQEQIVVELDKIFKKIKQ